MHIEPSRYLSSPPCSRQFCWFSTAMKQGGTFCVSRSYRVCLSSTGSLRKRAGSRGWRDSCLLRSGPRAIGPPALSHPVAEVCSPSDHDADRQLSAYDSDRPLEVAFGPLFVTLFRKRACECQQNSE